MITENVETRERKRVFTASWQVDSREIIAIKKIPKYCTIILVSKNDY